MSPLLFALVEFGFHRRQSRSRRIRNVIVANHFPGDRPRMKWWREEMRRRAEWVNWWLSTWVQS